MIHTSSPATLMLMGEHAVLRNYPCLVAAASPRLHVYITPRHDDLIEIESSLGTHTCTLSTLEIKPPFTFILSLMQQFQKKLRHGFHLKVVSEFDANLGLGSSAATLMATAAALTKLSGHEPLADPEALFRIAQKSLIEIQGKGSGADLAAALMGGIVYYQMQPLILEKLPCEIPLVAIYSGSKMPTIEVINIINAHEHEYQTYFEEIGKAVALGKNALLDNDMASLSDALILNQNSMEQMHLSNPNIAHIIQRLNLDPGILAAKISGSGLGDCVIGLGQLHNTHFPEGNFEQNQGIKSLPLTLSPLGLIEHE